jgi:hypothetical protein
MMATFAVVLPGNPDSFWQVFDPVNVLWATAAGFAFGITVLLAATLNFPSARYATPRVVFLVTSGLSALAGVVFYTSQLAEALVTGDPQIWRIIARAVLWVIFSVAIGAGLALGHRVAVDSPQTNHPYGVDTHPTEEG